MFRSLRQLRPAAPLFSWPPDLTAAVVSRLARLTCSSVTDLGR